MALTGRMRSRCGDVAERSGGAAGAVEEETESPPKVGGWLEGPERPNLAPVLIGFNRLGYPPSERALGAHSGSQSVERTRGCVGCVGTVIDHCVGCVGTDLHPLRSLWSSGARHGLGRGRQGLIPHGGEPDHR